MGWMEEVFLEAGAVSPRLRELANLREPRMRDKFIRAPQQLDSWRYSGQQRLVGLYDLWRANSGLYDKSVDRYLQSRSEEHTSELQSLMRISYAVFCLKKKNKVNNNKKEQ